MTVTIHVPTAPAAQADVLRRLIALAGGDRRAIRSGHTGLVVSDDLARAYLNDGQPAASGGQISRPVPPNLAQVVRQAENTGGLLQPPAPATAEPVALEKTTTRPPATRRPRRTQQQQEQQGAST